MTSVLHPSAVTADQSSRESLNWFNLNSYLRLVYEAIWSVNSIAFAAFALSIHIEPQNIGLATTAVSVACLMQLVSLPLLASIRNRKSFIVGFGLVEPILVVVTVVALLWLPVVWRLGVLLFSAAAATGMMHLTRPVTDDWLSQTVPSRIRTRYLGRRVQIVAVITIVSSVGIGTIVDWIGKDNSAGLALFIAIGALTGAGSVLALLRVVDGNETRHEEFRFADLKTPLTYRPFLLFLAGILAYNLAFFIGVPYYQVFYQKTLMMSPGSVGVATAGYAIAKIIAMQFWRKVLDRMSIQRVFTMLSPCYVMFFGLFVVSQPGRTWPIYIAWILAGLSDGAYGTILQATSFKIIPKDGVRPAYFALYNLIMMGTYGIGALAAWPILTFLARFETLEGRFPMSRYHILFAMMGVLLVMGVYVSKLAFDASDATLKSLAPAEAQ